MITPLTAPKLIERELVWPSFSPKALLIYNRSGKASISTWTSSSNIHCTPWEHILHTSQDETLAVDNKTLEQEKIKMHLVRIA